MAYNEVDKNGKPKSSRFPAQSCDRAAGNTLMQMGGELHDFKTVAAKSIASDEDAGATKAAPDRRIPVNLGDPKESFLDSVALVGCSKEKGWTEGCWGSGFLVSKCHLLTAHHVVFNHYKDEEMKLGKEIPVGFGQIDGAPWKSEKTIGTVVGFDPKIRRMNEIGKVEYSTGRDWAVIKLSKDKDGKYPGEKRKPLCLGTINNAPKFIEVKDLDVRSVGHPGNKFSATGKLHLWQDTKCKIVGAMGSTWHTSCQIRGGMSGGAITTYQANPKDEGNCWKPFGIISASKTQTAGFTKEEESDVSLTNMITPLDKYNRLMIDKALEQYPCD